jgi:hypothetical protein
VCIDPDDPTGLAGSDTTLTIAIEARGDTAQVEHAAEGQSVCAPNLAVPVRVRIQSADGRLDGTVDGDLGAGSTASSATFGFSRELSALGGSLAGQLPEGSKVSMVFGFYGGKVWLETYVMQPCSEGCGDGPRGFKIVLHDKLGAEDECVLELPRKDVDRTDPGRRTPDDRPRAEGEPIEC